ncbi:long-chain fatty acid--CoA ligase [Rhodococcus ruber Chol-4]|uniref:AMP-binding enzyme family protein n=1 Tax=Rhodococcus ruber TaxID=1830 RepID=A0A098BEA0_9NOCA|nr:MULTISPECIES: long-chain-fatty-acid--CoA ligase [Rhodococcus]AUM18887.1 long-chain fatty acid--CoA ligase [Rhodococcus ruber]KXF85512.1 long-chain fatty acid--CoA ligase [Rhodococcus ruber Chol-4]MBD8054004.1 long-chain-fatty-acid--CoA ligase [Rhodococcus ruber]MBP2213887.1 acyl-CoA synthetase (AMP-forming)/AMP-acid ligase II [Rhodococcus ruber]MCD2125019.1 long-chain-fatty-acid--CoA ligase [Rhodococcus ruber]
MSGLHLPQRVRQHAAERPDALALTCGDTTVTFAELDGRTNRVATALNGLARRGGRIGALLRMRLEAAETFVACGKAGLVFVPLNWRLTPAEAARIAEDAELDVLVVESGFAAAAEAIRAALPGLPVVLVDAEPGDELLPGAWTWQRLAGSGTDDDPGRGDDPDAVLLQLYTSGTTGTPKGVLITHRNLHNDEEGQRIYHWQPESVALNAMPLFHIAGAGWLSTCLSAGVHAVLLGEFHPRTVASLVEQHGITHAFLVPATVQMLLDLTDLDSFDLSSLQLIFYGASPVTPTMLRRAVRTLGCGFVQRYGMTETSGSVTALRVEDHDPTGPRSYLLRSAGRPMPGVEIAIRDVVTGEDLPVGQSGEIVCRSRHNTSGYWRRPEETAALFTDDGFLRTGDAGHLDEDGFLFVTDRVKDMIITGGENVYPIEVESVLAEHPAVAEVAVIGVPDRKWGEAVTAVVRVADGTAAPDASELVAFTIGRLASYKKPQRIHFVSELPRNAGGKILKRTLRDSLAEDVS